MKAENVRIKDVGAAVLSGKTGKNSACVNPPDVVMASWQRGPQVVVYRHPVSLS